MADLPFFVSPRNEPYCCQQPPSITPPQQAHEYQHIRDPIRSSSRCQRLGRFRSRQATPPRLKHHVKRSFRMGPVLSLFADKRSRIKDNRDSRLIRKQLEHYHEGYPRVAAFLDSDTDTALYRRFGILHARALLYKQVELTRLEAELHALDEEDNGKDGDGPNQWRLTHSISLNDGYLNDKRKELMEKIVQKLKEYDKAILQDAAMRKLPRPSKREHRNFYDYMVTEQPFGENEDDFIKYEDDFVSLQEYEKSWLDEITHRVVGHCRRGLPRRMFVTPEDQAKTTDPHIHYYSEERLGVAIKIFISVISTALLLIPIYLFLTFRFSAKLMAAITLVSTLFFSTAVSICTSAKRHEVFAATAAYCAVLVVFIGNLQQVKLTG